MSERESAVPARVPLDDCWNRIGTRGDNSCPRLEQHLRCLNCPVFAQAAARMLERPADFAASVLPFAARAGGARGEDHNDDHNGVAKSEGSLVFRVGAEWLALPAAVLQHVGEARPIHSLPHRRSAAVLGIVNVRGVLTLAVSLAALLHIESAPESAGVRAGRRRLLVAERGGETTAFPVDDVEGVAYFSHEALLPAPATLAQGAGCHVRGVLDWRGRSVGVLDVEALFEALTRSVR
ncbi:chemotaxis protein CheW [Paraburkholderia acidipaludis]|uniref:chemotaxis protein CheW n=1 Tax=Paraburkholderia acidipaludis TaxID=660537 RepID=UPI0004820F08|nr:chemotaxis protein CheW [Paraburkholderia acidipaludis]